MCVISTKCHDPDLHTQTDPDLTWILPTSFNTVALASGDSMGDSLCSRLGARRSSLCQHQVSTTQAGTLGMASHTPGHIGPNWRWCLKACPTQIEVNFVIDKLLSAILKRLVLLTINGSLFFSPLECFNFWGQVLIVGCLTYR